MTEHRNDDELRDLLAAAAMGVLDDGERVRVDAYLASSAEARDELRTLTAAADAIALSVPQLDPSKELKSRVMAVARAEARTEPEPAAPRRRWRLRLWPALAGGLAVACAALLAVGLTTRGPDVQTIEVRGTAAADQVRGTVTVLPGADAAVVQLRNLPPTAGGRGYELWAVRRDGTPVSAGFMGDTGGGVNAAAVGNLEDVVALAVTEEPRTNTTAPTGDRLVVVPVGTTG
jgi:anti-sigma-K factor RskA